MNLQTLAERFCATPLPDSVCTDLCASKPGYPGRTGTNLLTVAEAKEILKSVLADPPEDFHARLLRERDELAERLAKLTAFLGTDSFLQSIPKNHQVLLYSQSGLMQGYLNTLNKRLELLAPAKEVTVDLKRTETARGFSLIEFEDHNDTPCSLQKSSLATEDAIWFGVNDPAPKRLIPGLGWTPVEFPPDTSFRTRMHLTRAQVKELLPLLQNFVETGEVPRQEP